MRMVRAAVAVVVVALAASSGFAQSKDRADLPEQAKWRLADLYASDDAWRVAKDKFAARIPEATKLKGTLGQSPAQLATGLILLSDLNKDLSRLYTYAGLISDQDTRDTKYRAMKQEMDQLSSSFSSDTSFVEPEILKIDRATIDAYIGREPKLAPYAFYLHDLLRRQAHTLSEPEEKIIAEAGLMSSAPADVYGVFTNADFPFPTVTLADGTTRKLDLATFSVSRSLPNRDDRKKVFETFFGALGDYRGTIGTALNAEVQKDLFYMRVRKYPTTLDSALDADTIPASVYAKLIEGVNANLPTFHRYLNLRKRMIGIKDLHYYDLYAPLVANTKLEYSLDETKRTSSVRWLRSAPATPASSSAPSTTAGSISIRTPASAPGRIRTAGPTTSTPTCSSTSTAGMTTSARWRTSSGTRCRATSRTRTSPTRRPAIRSSSPRSRRRSTRHC
jgi:oligoendopeptidase F